MLNVYTIGFTKKTANFFFDSIIRSGVDRLIDVRLNNNSQLAGFAKKNDLKYFLTELCNVDYIHLPDLAPTKDILDAFKKYKGSWDVYEKEFLELMDKRSIEHSVDKEKINNSCLLCSEDQPHHCHRRLVVEYLNNRWDVNLKVKHLF